MKIRLLAPALATLLAAVLLAAMRFAFPALTIWAALLALAVIGTGAAFYGRHRAIRFDRQLDDRIRAAAVWYTAANRAASEPAPADKLYVLTLAEPETAGSRAPAWFRRRLAALERAGELRRAEGGYHASPDLMCKFGIRPELGPATPMDRVIDESKRVLYENER